MAISSDSLGLHVTRAEMRCDEIDVTTIEDTVRRYRTGAKRLYIEAVATGAVADALVKLRGRCTGRELLAALQEQDERAALDRRVAYLMAGVRRQANQIRGENNVDPDEFDSLMEYVKTGKRKEQVQAKGACEACIECCQQCEDRCAADPDSHKD
jgi:hypothetical protein